MGERRNTLDKYRDLTNVNASCGNDQNELARAMESADWMEQVRNLSSEYTLRTGRVRTYKLDVFGCQMNERDAETIAGMLTNMGFEQVQKDKPADIIVLVTCCVRENAEEKFYGHIGAMAPECEKHGSIVVAAGCMMQQPHVVERLKNTHRHVKIVFGTHNIHEFPRLLYTHLTSGERVFEVWDKESRIIEDMPIRRTHRHKAYVNIIYGCNNFCTYCIVPYVRGRERSRKKEDILAEIRALAADGCREVTLLGQNVNSYGNDLGEKDLFARLLYDIEEIDGIDRVRFTTSHPKDLSDSLIRAMKECSKVCEHLHLPFQAGSNRILQRMNRKYTREQYLDLVDRIREAVPDIALTTDIIVGFPSETEEDFEDTLDLVRRVKFEAAFTFIYSPRKGTPAEKWQQTEPSEVISQRFKRLVEVQTEIATQLAKRYEGRTVEVLVDGPSKTNPEMQSGRTRTGRLVNFRAERDLTGQLVDVDIIRAGAFWLEGREVNRRG